MGGGAQDDEERWREGGGERDRERERMGGAGGYRAGYDATLLALLAKDCVGLARACLAIREDAGIVSLQDMVHLVRHPRGSAAAAPVSVAGAVEWCIFQAAIDRKWTRSDEKIPFPDKHARKFPARISKAESELEPQTETAEKQFCRHVQRPTC